MAIAAALAVGLSLPPWPALTGDRPGPSAVTIPPSTPDPGVAIKDGALWLSPEEIAALPTVGGAWERLDALAADGPGRPIDVSNQDSELVATYTILTLVKRLEGSV